jgi:hypothetical protein
VGLPNPFVPAQWDLLGSIALAIHPDSRLLSRLRRLCSSPSGAKAPAISGDFADGLKTVPFEAGLSQSFPSAAGSAFQYRTAWRTQS